MEAMELREKVVFVTGGARRVGRAIALAFAERGSHVAISYNTSPADAEQTVAACEERGVRALAVRGNVARPQEAEAMIGRVAEGFGRLDVLVNNAAIYYPTPLGSVTEEQWDAFLDINAKGPFFCAQAAAPMLRAGGGKIVNIADWAGERPYEDYLPYCISKAGVIALTKGLARELAPEVQVNAIAPGPVLLPENYGDQERRDVIAAVPLRRIGSPEDIARTAIFLCEGTDFMTGAIVPVDGGRLIG
jgi:pteridine reductase